MSSGDRVEPSRAKRMTPQKPRHRKSRSDEGTVPSHRLLRISGTGRLEPARSAKQKPQAHLVDPDPRPQGRAQNLPIQDLEKSSQSTAPRLGRIELPPPRTPPRSWLPSRPARHPREDRSGVPASGTPPGAAASNGSSRRRFRPCGSRQSPRGVRLLSSGSRTLRREGSRSAALPGTRARSRLCGGARPPGRNGLPSNRNTVPPLAPAPGEDGPAALSAHAHEKPVGAAASAPIRLERSFHFVMTPGSDVRDGYQKPPHDL